MVTDRMIAITQAITAPATIIIIGDYNHTIIPIPTTEAIMATEVIMAAWDVMYSHHRIIVRVR